ncbi:aminoglycoside 3'-phosphotransferase [Nocardiopsis sp. L17-MgMaSL7]|uniref:aminoglycoside 3'-phosphotransferase n=1 Tax=Nocardiopsis sp. L17-MgMaSL7 TaxID=1938893 RepID=UPI000D7143B8|nr:aminoglycoside 3'-phosphotransferase [Nocardiopsis sp. L17-MgMaSL7]PWV50265.1 kanamycin kinase [Nocardiopsis sp. L17-MgMaSL7]
MELPRFEDAVLRSLRTEEVHVGLSGARVFRMYDHADRPVAVFKGVPPDRPDLARELDGEISRTAWMARFGLATPRVLEHESREDGPPRWVVSSHLPGVPAHEPETAREHPRLVELLAEAARTIHASEVGAVEVVRERLAEQLERARKRVAAGLVQRSWQGSRYAGTDPARALAEVGHRVERAGPLPEVVTHGDFCLPNVLVTADGAWGLVDLGQAGVADPHRDLAAMVGSLLSPLNPQFGQADADRFLDAYGRDRVDPELLSLHFGVDDFFWPVPPA